VVGKYFDLVGLSREPIQSPLKLTVNRYYLNDILDLIGITVSLTKSKINVGIACWGLVIATILALVVPRFRRRPAYLTCVTALITVYICWTVSMERYMTTKAQGAAVATLVFIFLYTPAYNIGYNALTYSTFFPRLRFKTGD
jgi:xanthine/uracil permease